MKNVDKTKKNVVIVQHNKKEQVRIKKNDNNQ